MANRSLQRNGFIVEIKCPRCGKPLDEINSRSYSGEFVALAKCRFKGCAHEWAVRMVVAPAHRREDSLEASKCGTDAGFMAHRRKGEKGCEDCNVAHAQVERNRRKVAAK